MDEAGITSEAPARPERHHRWARLLLVVLVASIVIGATLFVVTLPPPLSIKEGSTSGPILANFPTTTSTLHPAFGNFTATTYANQTSGPSSNLTLKFHSYGWAMGDEYGVIDHVDFFYYISVLGKFAPNLHPGALRLACNVTGSHIATEFHHEIHQGPNVSVNPQQVFAFFDNGTGALTASLANSGGTGPFYAFEYRANGWGTMRYQYTQYLGFRATVTGWMLPAISVSLGFEIRNVPRSLTLFPAGTAWAFYGPGYLASSFDVSTAAPFTVAGAFNASAPVTAYILNLSEYSDLLSNGDPTTWHWISSPGVTAYAINVTLPPRELWYLAFHVPSPGNMGGWPVTVVATQRIVATT